MKNEGFFETVRNTSKIEENYKTNRMKNMKTSQTIIDRNVSEFDILIGFTALRVKTAG